MIGTRRAGVIAALVLALASLTCGAPPASYPTAGPGPTQTEVPTATVPSGTSPSSTALPPFPDFPDVLTFGVGGGPGPCYMEYPDSPESMKVSGHFGIDVVLCIYLRSLDPNVPIRITLSQPGTSGTVLSSPDLIFTGPEKQLYWQYQVGGRIVRVKGEGEIREEDGSLKLPLYISWPVTRSAGRWLATVAQAGRPPVSQEFEITKKPSASYVSIRYPGDDHELAPAHWSTARSIVLRGDAPLQYGGIDFPPSTPVYVLLYRQVRAGFTLDYQLAWKGLSISDESGMISGPISESFAGGNYILFATTDPDTLAVKDGFASFNPNEVKGSDRDDFHIVPLSCPGALPQRMVLGDSGQVCTQDDPVRLRFSPSRSADFERLLAPGALFTVVDGPACADNWSWWFVRTEDGTGGWVAEGGDEVDPYFICP